MEDFLYRIFEEFITLDIYKLLQAEPYSYDKCYPPEDEVTKLVKELYASNNKNIDKTKEDLIEIMVKQEGGLNGTTKNGG